MLRHTSNFGCELVPLGDILDVCQSGWIPFAGGDWEPRLRAKGILLGSCEADKEASMRKGLSPNASSPREGLDGSEGDIWNPGKGFYRWLGMDTGFCPRGHQK